MCKSSDYFAFSFTAITVRDRELRRNRIVTIACCVENANIMLGPNESHYIEGYIEKEINAFFFG